MDGSHVVYFLNKYRFDSLMSIDLFISDLVDNETAMAVAIAAASVAATASTDFVSSTKKSLSQYSVPALALLGEILAPMLDIIYSSDEKEKVCMKSTTAICTLLLYLEYNVVQNLLHFTPFSGRSTSLQCDA